MPLHGFFILFFFRDNAWTLYLMHCTYALNKLLFSCGTLLGLSHQFLCTGTGQCTTKTADSGLQTAACGLRTADCGLQTADCGLRTANCKPRNVDGRLWTAYCELRTADYELGVKHRLRYKTRAKHCGVSVNHGLKYEMRTADIYSGAYQPHFVIFNDWL